MSLGTKPTRSDLQAILADIFTEILEKGERERAMREPGPPPWKNAESEEEAWKAAMLDPAFAARQLEGDLEVNNLDGIAETVDQHLAKRRLSLPKDSLEYRLFCRQALETSVRALRIDSDRWEGIVANAPASTARTQDSAAAGTLNATLEDPLFSEAFETYRAMKAQPKKDDRRTRPADWKERKTRLDAERTKDTFLELMGDLRLSQITPEIAMRFRQRVSEMPKWNGKGIYTGRAADAAVELANEISNKLEAGANVIIAVGKELTRDEAQRLTERVSLRTINKHLIFLSNFWKTVPAMRRLHARNPFLGLLYDKSAVREESAETGGRRRALRDDFLRRLFDTPIWTGCRSADNRVKPGKMIVRDAKFFAPLIALYSGMRLEEILQLRVRDIEQRNGIWLFVITRDKDTRLKTEAAERVVPIHDELIRLGFLDHWNDMQARGERRLFPELRVGKHSDKFGYAFSKWFARYRRATKTYEHRKDFHALRHTFITRLRQAGVDRALVASIVGHEQEGTTDAEYLDEAELRDRKNAVERLAAEIDLSHLYVKGPFWPARKTRERESMRVQSSRRAVAKKGHAESSLPSALTRSDSS